MTRVLLYYKYVHIQDPLATQKEHMNMCMFLGLKGRIILAHEGINGTIAGEEEAINAYKAWMAQHPLFFDIEFKEGVEEENVFKKMNIKVRDELVTLHQDVDITAPDQKRGTYIEPEELNRMIASGEEFYIVDVRNNYESYIGKFKGSIALDIDNFRDLPTGIQEIVPLKNKKVITVCTGGIRCEKASAYLIKEGFADVYQLHGGIVKYGKLFPDEGFEGKCYVFDSRVAIPINTPENEKVIAVCYHCHKQCDRYINCCNAVCNRQFVCCEACSKKYENGCSTDCQNHSRFKVTETNSQTKS